MVADSAAAAPRSSAKQRAAQSFAAGKASFERGDFAAAGAAFEQAALHVPHPATLLNAAEAWELAGDHVRAAQICDRVLDMEDLETRYREVANTQLERLSKRIATIHVRVPPGARVSVDGERDESTDHRIRLKPGSHVIVAEGDGITTRREVIEVSPGEMRELDLTGAVEVETPATASRTTEAPEEKDAKTERRSSGPPAGTWVALGVGAAAAGVAGFFGFRTLEAKDAFDANPTVQTAEDFKQARLMTNVSAGVAIAAAAVGVVLWIAAPRAQARPRNAWSLEGAGARAVFAF